MNREPRVSVLVCTRNRPHELADCLASIERSNLAVHEVIVSDDGDDPSATRALCAASTRVRHLDGPRSGLCANRNNALTAVTGTHVLFLDDDAQLGEHFLEQATECLSALPQELAARTIVTGRERRPDGRLTAAREQSFLGFQEIAYRATDDWRTVVINAALFPAALFDRLQFDERIRYGYDEVDLTTRAVALGFRIVYAADAVNLHNPSPASRGGYDRVVDASRLYVTFKRYALTDRKRSRAIAFALLASAHLLAAAVKDAGPRGAIGATAALRLSATHIRAARRDAPAGVGVAA